MKKQILLIALVTGLAASAERVRPTEPFVALELPNTPANPRNSEGDFAALRDGRVLFVYTHYTKGAGGDNDPAVLASRVSTDGGLTWSAESKPVVANEGGMNVMCASLLRLADGALALFYNVKNSGADCRVVMRVSRDDGETWSAPAKCIPDEEKEYYVFENCRAERLSDGRLIFPVSLHAKGDGYGRLVCWFSDDGGKTWRRGSDPFAAFDPAGNRITLQEPGLVEQKDGRLLMYARTAHGRQWYFYSSDRGATWSAGRPSRLIGPCSPATLKRLSNGDLVAVWNDHTDRPEYAARDGLWGVRRPMTVAVSRDDGLTWHHRRVLGDSAIGDWYCYFGVMEHRGNLLIGYCAKNHLKFSRVAVVPLSWIYEGADDVAPTRNFVGFGEGGFQYFSTVDGVWSAKRGDAEIANRAAKWMSSYTSNRGRGVHLFGGTNRAVYVELPIGADARSLRLCAKRFDDGRTDPCGFKVEGKSADGAWRTLSERPCTSSLAPVDLKGATPDMTVLRFVTTSADGVYLTD